MSDVSISDLSVITDVNNTDELVIQRGTAAPLRLSLGSLEQFIAKRSVTEISISTEHTAVSAWQANYIIWRVDDGTLNLDSISDLGTGWWLSIINRSNTSLTISPDGTEQIDGESSYTLGINQFIFIHNNGTEFFTLGLASSSGSGLFQTRVLYNGINVNFDSTEEDKFLALTYDGTNYDWEDDPNTAGLANIQVAWDGLTSSDWYIIKAEPLGEVFLRGSSIFETIIGYVPDRNDVFASYIAGRVENDSAIYKFARDASNNILFYFEPLPSRYNIDLKIEKITGIAGGTGGTADIGDLLELFTEEEPESTGRRLLGTVGGTANQYALSDVGLSLLNTPDKSSARDTIDAEYLFPSISHISDTNFVSTGQSSLGVPLDFTETLRNARTTYNKRIEVEVNVTLRLGVGTSNSDVRVAIQNPTNLQDLVDDINVNVLAPEHPDTQRDTTASAGVLVPDNLNGLSITVHHVGGSDVFIPKIEAIPRLIKYPSNAVRDVNTDIITQPGLFDDDLYQLTKGGGSEDGGNGETPSGTADIPDTLLATYEVMSSFEPSYEDYLGEYYRATSNSGSTSRIIYFTKLQQNLRSGPRDDSDDIVAPFTYRDSRQVRSIGHRIGSINVSNTQNVGAGDRFTVLPDINDIATDPAPEGGYIEILTTSGGVASAIDLNPSGRYYRLVPDVQANAQDGVGGWPGANPVLAPEMFETVSEWTATEACTLHFTLSARLQDVRVTDGSTNTVRRWFSFVEYSIDEGATWQIGVGSGDSYERIDQDVPTQYTSGRHSQRLALGQKIRFRLNVRGTDIDVRRISVDQVRIVVTRDAGEGQVVAANPGPSFWIQYSDDNSTWHDFADIDIDNDRYIRFALSSAQPVDDSDDWTDGILFRGQDAAQTLRNIATERFAIPSALSNDDRLFATDEGASGDPLKYITADTLRTYMFRGRGDISSNFNTVGVDSLGIWEVSPGAINGPPDVNTQGILIISQYRVTLGSALTQVFIPTDTSGPALYVRSLFGSNWSDWKSTGTSTISADLRAAANLSLSENTLALTDRFFATDEGTVDDPLKYITAENLRDWSRLPHDTAVSNFNSVTIPSLRTVAANPTNGPLGVDSGGVLVTYRAGGTVNDLVQTFYPNSGPTLLYSRRRVSGDFGAWSGIVSTSAVISSSEAALIWHPTGNNTLLAVVGSAETLGVVNQYTGPHSQNITFEKSDIGSDLPFPARVLNGGNAELRWLHGVNSRAEGFRVSLLDQASAERMFFGAKFRSSNTTIRRDLISFEGTPSELEPGFTIYWESVNDGGSIIAEAASFNTNTNLYEFTTTEIVNIGGSNVVANEDYYVAIYLEHDISEDEWVIRCAVRRAELATDFFAVGSERDISGPATLGSYASIGVTNDVNAEAAKNTDPIRRTSDDIADNTWGGEMWDIVLAIPDSPMTEQDVRERVEDSHTPENSRSELFGVASYVRVVANLQWSASIVSAQILTSGEHFSVPLGFNFNISRYTEVVIHYSYSLEVYKWSQSEIFQLSTLQLASHRDDIMGSSSISTYGGIVPNVTMVLGEDSSSVLRKSIGGQFDVISGRLAFISFVGAGDFVTEVVFSRRGGNGVMMITGIQFR